jgi:A/G-specific adenine glycosylase
MQRKESTIQADINKAFFRRRLLAWFARHKRDLPWRREPRDPYHVWLSEIMLQQTQVATVIPYYERWLVRFPTLVALAQARLDDVLKMWEGLGYYSRAHNLHRAARVVVNELGGRVPSVVDELLKLPGIGRYTAGAIASLAYQQRAPILDGNVTRVLSRVYALVGDVKSPAMVKELWRLSEALLPARRVGEFNEAMMELGAMICTPRSPNCSACPLNTLCIAYAKGTPEAYPAKSARHARPHKDVATAVIVDNTDHYLIAQRLAHGLLGSLWEFPGGEVTLSSSNGISAQLADILLAQTGLRLDIQDSQFIGQVRHGFTHFELTRHVALVSVPARQPKLHKGEQYQGLRWVSRKGLQELALARSDHKILQLTFSEAARSPRLL